MPQLVKASVLATFNLVNPKTPRSRRILQRFRNQIFDADSSAQQTNRAAKPATMSFLKRAAAGRTRGNLLGSGLHLPRYLLLSLLNLRMLLSCGQDATQVAQFFIHFRRSSHCAADFFPQNCPIARAQPRHIAAQSRDRPMQLARHLFIWDR